MPKLPKTIYAKWEQERNANEFYIVAHEAAFTLAEDDGTPEVVGVYQLVGKKRVEKIVKVTDAKP